MFRTGNQDVYFSSEPPDAEIWVMGQNTGQKTPSTVKVKRKVRSNTYKNNAKHQQIYELKKEGYKEFFHTDIGRFNAGSAIAWYLDLCTWGIGLIVDIPKGAFRVYQNSIIANLTPASEYKKNYNADQLSSNENNAIQRSPYNESPASDFDVDNQIPVTPTKNPYRFALVIGNEDYNSFQKGLSTEVNVAFAENDARIFAEYVTQTLGVPDENLTMLINANAMDMNRALKKINLLIKNTAGKAEIIFYYAGHGFPDEKTQEPYLMPVDVSGSELDFAIKLNTLYKSLTEYPSQKITVFLDACFSGGARDQGLLAARGVKIKPKEGQLNGKMVVFSASSGEQSSLPYKEKKHGLFTYFLLRKLQESRGVLTYKQLSDYLTEQVGVKSIIINNKEQNPQTNVSVGAQDIWKLWSFK
ncbi:MAG: hypothetical protein A2275_01370 [Bacteroidetes bacterium RIFOXYA12_FULL_35_11]|nr:MAG: hypothetical protein A2X01_21315 [Bacteroidetes bacterium GWF2_35_48]OFY72455.1 MAG: hypothetical protein A2275_01370 [Bacteroidetes bacterium RIFOXYA12_FULL_35_11]OFY96391.1 MAG: hypothetical protein A2491_21835 [Bacteroidetes bacterium RIFOXYC12_FULL_35_7]OFY97418.1 MAG: hypothetical protein A2309_03400 [Bacteroidetes bacterium RIFOXYB2_FULL_35_7]